MEDIFTMDLLLDFENIKYNLLMGDQLESA